MGCDLAQDRNQSWAVVSAEMNFEFHKMWGIKETLLEMQSTASQRDEIQQSDKSERLKKYLDRIKC
jgi:hypothetical protein